MFPVSSLLNNVNICYCHSPEYNTFNFVSYRITIDIEFLNDKVCACIYSRVIAQLLTCCHV